MGWFSKKKDVIDFSRMKREIKPKEDCVDLTSQPVTQPDEGFGFFGAIANSVETGVVKEIGEVHLQHLKVKIEDVEYKLDNFSKRISGLIDRVDLIEKKMDRFERRGV